MSAKYGAKDAKRQRAEAIHARENGAAEKRGYDGPTLPFGPNTLIGFQHLAPYERRRADVELVSGQLESDYEKDASPGDRKRWETLKATAKARIDADPDATAMLREARHSLKRTNAKRRALKPLQKYIATQLAPFIAQLEAFLNTLPRPLPRSKGFDQLVAVIVLANALPQHIADAIAEAVLGAANVRAEVQLTEQINAQLAALA